jgi:hypothetical protein
MKRLNCMHCLEQKLNSYIFIKNNGVFCSEDCLLDTQESKSWSCEKRKWKTFQWDEIKRRYSQIDNIKYTCHYLQHYGW